MDEQLYRLTADGQRLDTFLAGETGLTRSRVARLMEQGLCLVDSKPETKAGAKPKPGAAVELRVPAPKPAKPEAQDIPLEIVYEDDALALVHKPCGMVVHPAPGHEDGTLVNALLYRLDSLGSIGGEERPGILHRLDKDTSGLLLIAKTDAAQLSLSAQLAARTMEKHYRALVSGAMAQEHGFIDQPIARSKKDRQRMAIDPQGRSAQTEWTKLAEGRGCTLLDVHILTGRTHQIRVHMLSIGHPVLGDPIYGSGRALPMPRLMLHAYSLAFDHPVTGERMTFTAPVPEAFRAGLKKAGLPEDAADSPVPAPADRR